MFLLDFTIMFEDQKLISLFSDKPSFTKEGEPPSSMTIYDGYTNLLLPCAGKGNPNPAASWKRTGLSLPEVSLLKSA